MKIVRPVLAALSVSSQIRKQQVENCLTDCSSAVLAKLKHPSSQLINPSNAETNFVQTQECKDFCQPAKPYLVGIHWIALAEYSQMSTYLPGFQIHKSKKQQSSENPHVLEVKLLNNTFNLARKNWVWKWNDIWNIKIPLSSIAHHDCYHSLKAVNHQGEGASDTTCPGIGKWS